MIACKNMTDDEWKAMRRLPKGTRVRFSIDRDGASLSGVGSIIVVTIAPMLATYFDIAIPGGRITAIPELGDTIETVA